MNNSNQTYAAGEGGLNRFFTKMYGFMAGAVAFSALIAYLCATTFQMSVLNFFGTHRFAFFALFAIQLVMVFGVSFKPGRSAVSSIVMLFTFAGIEGLFLSTILMVYDISHVTMAFVAAATEFVVLAIFGATTKKDLSGFGKQALAALIALILVTFINIFLQSPMISYIFSFVGVIIFTILTAWDSQNFKNMYLQFGDQVNTTSLAVSGALQLYLDFINIFIQLLTIFSGGSSRD